MALVFTSVLQEAGYQARLSLWISSTAGRRDVLLCDVAGEVVSGNSLNDERQRVLLTPGHWVTSRTVYERYHWQPDSNKNTPFRAFL
ncbi:hypothetical protein GL381_20360 [Salmonella enterica]|uniref:Uncharacterized protein n=1 Tax=Salmonella enterica TaxID=28901 RepID=A0A5Y2ZZ98_SALER|nr:hypothetical protein [Salmonella enterica]EAS0937461.1 hypothetical protein [Salmonella enterica]EAT9250839.1 hypothetical protein [Salmonella enterica]EAV7952726.1 hypothetical protein [Salmonella enterica]EAV9264985.1 hypothetical protein [Salmonella enterica]